MLRMITAVGIVALTSMAMSGPAAALKFDLGGKIPAFNQKGAQSTSPGDAFHPDTAAVGDPKAECLEKGGKPVRISGEYDFYWSCEL